VNPRAPSKEAMLERAVMRVADDETFVASVLRDWGGGRLDLDATTSFLGCDRSAAIQLALCRRPETTAPAFRSDVAKIAAHAGVDENRLLGLLREAASIAAFRKADGAQMLAAARDDRGPKRDGET
jgi:hypothetical protein